VLPDADEAIFHIFAEASDEDGSEELAERFVAAVRRVIDEQT
jgi:phosphomannomutase